MFDAPFSVSAKENTMTTMWMVRTFISNKNRWLSALVRWQK